MSRSRKRTPIFGNAASRSEREDKRVAAKRMRALERQALHHGAEPPTKHEAFDMEWCGGKDGKRWWARVKPEDMRK